MNVSANNTQAGFGTKALIWLLLILLLIGGASWWMMEQKKSQKNQQHNYITERVSKRDIEAAVLASGTLEALKQVDVGAQVSGEISTLYVEIGDRVNKGDPIAEIDARTQENTRDKAQAQLQSRQAALQSAQANLREAQQTYDRQQILFSRGATSRANLQSATTALDTAKSKLEQAKLAVRESQLQVDTAGLDLGYTNVSAPMSGVIISVAVEQGQTVNAVQAAPTIVTIAQLDTMLVRAEIAEADVDKVSPGMPAYFHLLGNTSKRFNTTLQSIDPAPTNISDNNYSNSQTAVYYYGQMQIDNPNGELRIGMTANTHIITARSNNVLSIPMTALQTQLEENVYEVQVLTQAQAQAKTQTETRKVSIGVSDGIYAQVLDGLSEGDEVVISTLAENATPSTGRGRPF